MDRVLGYEPRGRGFESCRARHPCIKEVCFLRGTGLFYCPSRIACLKGKGQKDRPERRKSRTGAVQSRTGGGSEQRVSCSSAPAKPSSDLQDKAGGAAESWSPMASGTAGTVMYAPPKRDFTAGWPRPCAADFALSLCPVGQGCPGAAEPVRAGAADGNLGAPSATRTPRRHASGISAVTDG